MYTAFIHRLVAGDRFPDDFFKWEFRNHFMFFVAGELGGHEWKLPEAGVQVNGGLSVDYRKTLVCETDAEITGVGTFHSFDVRDNHFHYCRILLLYRKLVYIVFCTSLLKRSIMNYNKLFFNVLNYESSDLLNT